MTIIASHFEKGKSHRILLLFFSIECTKTYKVFPISSVSNFGFLLHKHFQYDKSNACDIHLQHTTAS
jgi:hypothetical protein